MLKLFKMTTVPLIALSVFGVLVSEAALSSPPPETKPPQVAQPEAKVAPEDEPLCYEQITNNTTVNLSSLCNQTPKKSNVSSTPTPTRTPYNYTAIKKFNDEVYGKDN